MVRKQQSADRYGNNPLAVKIVGTSIQNLFDAQTWVGRKCDRPADSGFLSLNTLAVLLSPLNKPQPILSEGYIEEPLLVSF